MSNKDPSFSWHQRNPTDVKARSLTGDCCLLNAASSYTQIQFDPFPTLNSVQILVF